MKKMTILMVLCILSFGLAGCGEKTAEEQAKEKENLADKKARKILEKTGMNLDKPGK